MSSSRHHLNWNISEWNLKVMDTAWSFSTLENELLLNWQKGIPFLPCTAHGEPTITRVTYRSDENHVIRIIVDVEGLPDISTVCVELVKRQDHLELKASFEARADGALYAWDIFPTGTLLNLFTLLHMRNRHHFPRVIERYALGGRLSGGELGEGGEQGGFRVSTDSCDYQFAPNPSYYVLEKNEWHFFVGAKDLPQGFGMVVEKGAERRILKRWWFDCGEGTFLFRKGETIESPTLCIFAKRGCDYWDMVDHWVDILMREGRIPDQKGRVFTDDMLRPYLGPWVDQCYYGKIEGDTDMIWNWGGESKERARKVEAVCNEKFIRAEVDRAIEYGLPFGSVGIDDRWFRWRGDFEVHENRFPDMRKLVDWIHSKGMKALLWLTPFDVEPQAQMNLRTEWLAGGGAKSKHKQAFLDYSNPEVQEKWFLPKLQLWFGDGPGCWNADGFKLDFTADKIPRDIPIHDRSWHGEEMFIWKWYQFVYNAMKSIKPDSILLGCAAHPYFGQYQDWLRTYDICSTDFREHATRGLRIRHLCPGPLLSYDFHGREERREGYFKQALADGAHIEIGALFGFSGGGLMAPEDIRLIKKYLDQSKPIPGLRNSPALENEARIWSML